MYLPSDSVLLLTTICWDWTKTIQTVGRGHLLLL